MPNDAKLGLVLGIGLVIAIGVVFFRKDGDGGGGPARTAAAVQQAAPSSQGGSRAPGRVLRHTVQEGDTLYSLARHYYKDNSRFVEIYRANQEVLKTPEALTPGAVLLLPDVPTEMVAAASSEPAQ
jgi:nucleoid-associated protein YgaU